MKHAIVIAAFLALFLFGCIGSSDLQPQASEQALAVSEPAVQQADAQPQLPPPLENSYPVALPLDNNNLMPLPQAAEPEQKPLWDEGGIAIAGNYADADIIEYEPGKFRMYYALEPEVPGFKGQIYSATSTDGISWKDEGELIDGATFPSAINLDDGTYRMYYQNQQEIKSSTSKDGLSWTQETGTRMGYANDAGLKLTNVGAPTVIKAGNEYVMVYFGAIDEAYPEKVPNPDTHLLLWATSTDGVNFESKGIAFDSRNDQFKGWVDGPELVQWENELRLYFWGYTGVYHVDFDGTSFSKDAVFDYLTPQTNPMSLFPESPPGDPTIWNANGQWLMYYGQHTEGIYYATYAGE